MAHLHEVRDADTHYIIDPITMAITNANEAKNKLMLGDHGSEIFTFELPEYVEFHDMSLCNMVEVHFINIGTNKADQSVGVYPVNDLAIAEDAAGTLVFTWKVSGECTKYPGSLNYRIKFACTDESGNYTYKKWTDVYKGITISDGFDNGAATAAEYSDILSAWEARLDAFESQLEALEQNGGGGGLGGADWNAAEGEPGHVLNRTHWEEPVNPYFNGDIADRETFPVGGISLVKMSDSIISEADCIGAEVVVDMGGERQTITVTENYVADLTVEFGLPGFAIGEFFVVILKESGTFGDASFTKGTYYLSTEMDGTQIYTHYFSALKGDTVHKLDNKFLDLDWIPKKEKVMGERTEYVAETTIEYTGSRTTKFVTAESLVEGKTYIVMWDGSEYVCECKKLVYTDQSGQFLYIGNLSITGYGVDAVGVPVVDTKEPFVISDLYNMNGDRLMGDLSVMRPASDSAQTVTLRIVKVDITEEAPKLPVEYLPEGYPYTEPNGVLLAETEATKINNSTFGEVWATEQEVPPLEVGKTYTIFYNGTPYRCVGQTAPASVSNDPTAVCVGNFSVVGGEDTGEPFAMVCQAGGALCIDLSGASSVSIGIEGDVIHKMDEKYLPTSAASGGNPFGDKVEIVHLDITSLALSHTIDELYEMQGAGKSFVLAENPAAIFHVAANDVTVLMPGFGTYPPVCVNYTCLHWSKFTPYFEMKLYETALTETSLD